ncbi:DoxX family protein [Dyadobacter crusticola]|uniref:DoxX family protein n=1 Tax=Dyadobacter crusticola TaxID=292407 RepID=UPI00054CF41E|nr:DoxX family protein [Dyadobacter crusticola]
MKRTTIVYWILHVLLALLMGVGAIFDLISAPEAVAHITHIGYPAYIVPFLGLAKILGVIAILVPGYPRLKEWAYAGLAYDLIGALYSHIAFGEGIETWGGLIVGLILIAAAYFYYHKKVREAAPLSYSHSL